jgi:carbon-monoxide dehydrogenase large subunit
VFEDGLFRVTGTDRVIALLDVAAKAPGTLDTYHQWTREAMTFPNGTHIAEVEVDPETGAVTLERLTAVDDYGVIVNPMVAAGQAHGAIAQGAGQALLEQAVYDAESGQPVSGTFMDYAMPRAGDLPSFDLRFAGTRCTTNPVGVKGCGEAGAIALFPAIANAIADAVGVTALNGPASAFRVWHAMRNSAC